MKRVLLLYVPVLHEGYLKVFEAEKGADALYLIGEDLTASFFPFGKEIRAIDSTTMRSLIESLHIFPVVSVLTKDRVGELKGVFLMSARDEICERVIGENLQENTVEYVDVFLRWDSKNVAASMDVVYDRISKDPFDREMVRRAHNESEKSSDWWRHIGAVVVKDKQVIFEAHNEHVPSEHMPYAQGDPRDVIESGTLNTTYTSLHAEQAVIAEAARKGISLQGTSMYMEVFPCPMCAKLMAYAGITKCFFKTGSAWLDASSILKAKGVEIILVA